MEEIMKPLNRLAQMFPIGTPNQATFKLYYVKYRYVYLFSKYIIDYFYIPANTNVESFPFSMGGAHCANNEQSAGNINPLNKIKNSTSVFCIKK